MNSERLYKQTLSLHRFKPESVTAVTESVKLAGASIHTEESICKRQLLKKDKVSFRQRSPTGFPNHTSVPVTCQALVRQRKMISTALFWSFFLKKKSHTALVVNFLISLFFYLYIIVTDFMFSYTVFLCLCILCFSQFFSCCFYSDLFKIFN